MELRVGDQAWIATALLHRERPERSDFSLREIRERVRAEFGQVRPGVWQHILSHGVAQNQPTPGRLRDFTQTGRGRRRLFRPGDRSHPRRRTARSHPERDRLPEKYRELVDWYLQGYVAQGPNGQSSGGSTKPAAFAAFVGLIPAYDLQLMQQYIEQDCERIEDEQSS